MKERDNWKKGKRQAWYSWKMLGIWSVGREINHLNWRKERSRLIAEDHGEGVSPDAIAAMK